MTNLKMLIVAFPVFFKVKLFLVFVVKKAQKALTLEWFVWVKIIVLDNLPLGKTNRNMYQNIQIYVFINF